MLWALRIGAILLILVGLIFLGQGLSLLPSRVMYGSPFWGVVGLLMAVVGIGLGYWSLRR